MKEPVTDLNVEYNEPQYIEPQYIEPPPNVSATNGNVRKKGGTQGKHWVTAPSKRKQHGLHTLERQIPDMMKRITDNSITDLSPVELAAKSFRDALIEDHGGLAEISAA